METKDFDIRALIDKLCGNRISKSELDFVTRNATPDNLAEITFRVFDSNKDELLQKSRVAGTLDKLNAIKNSVRNKKYFSLINRKFAYRSKKNSPNGTLRRRVIVAEGDSWFNYPIILKDIIDWVALEPNFAVYSLAAGGDWLFNMINKRDYVDGLSIHRPDVFLISGGGNDIVGLYRVATIVDSDTESNMKFGYGANDWIKMIMQNPSKPEPPELNNGIKYLSKDFFALLMLFRVQFYSLIKPLIIDGCLKFPELKVVMQGYDYPEPSINNGLSFNPLKWYIPLLRQLGHGHWLKTPMMIRGIPVVDQTHVARAMIYFYNEMQKDVAAMLNLDCRKVRNIDWNPVHHVDFRGEVKSWTDELHPSPKGYHACAKLLIKTINELP